MFASRLRCDAKSEKSHNLTKHVIVEMIRLLTRLCLRLLWIVPFTDLIRYRLDPAAVPSYWRPRMRARLSAASAQVMSACLQPRWVLAQQRIQTRLLWMAMNVLHPRAQFPAMSAREIKVSFQLGFWYFSILSSHEHFFWLRCSRTSTHNVLLFGYSIVQNVRFS